MPKNQTHVAQSNFRKFIAATGYKRLHPRLPIFEFIDSNGKKIKCVYCETSSVKPECRQFWIECDGFVVFMKKETAFRFVKVTKDEKFSKNFSRILPCWKLAVCIKKDVEQTKVLDLDPVELGLIVTQRKNDLNQSIENFQKIPGTKVSNKQNLRQDAEGNLFTYCESTVKNGKVQSTIIHDVSDYIVINAKGIGFIRYDISDKKGFSVKQRSLGFSETQFKNRFKVSEGTPYKCDM